MSFYDEFFGNRSRRHLGEFAQLAPLTACFKIAWSPVFEEKAGWRGATREHTLNGSVTEEQRSQAAFSAKTLRAAVLLAVACVGSAVTARFGDAPASPPWPQPKSLAAGPHAIFRPALMGGTSHFPLDHNRRNSAIASIEVRNFCQLTRDTRQTGIARPQI